MRSVIVSQVLLQGSQSHGQSSIASFFLFGVMSANEYIYIYIYIYIQCQSKNSPLQFSDIFPKRLGIFNQFLHTYYTFLSGTRLQIFIQLFPTLTLQGGHIRPPVVVWHFAIVPGIPQRAEHVMWRRHSAPLATEGSRLLDPDHWTVFHRTWKTLTYRTMNSGGR